MPNQRTRRSPVRSQRLAVKDGQAPRQVKVLPGADPGNPALVENRRTRALASIA